MNDSIGFLKANGQPVFDEQNTSIRVLYANDEHIIRLKPPIVTILIPKNANSEYTCPKCKLDYKGQGITGHVKACAKHWCISNGVLLNDELH
jgi:hypothetical protein